jgi:hypothetical protein
MKMTEGVPPDDPALKEGFASDSLQADTIVASGLAFLRQRQLPHGEFVTLLGRTREMTDPVLDSSPFVTGQIVAILTTLGGFPVSDILSKATSFLQSEMEFGGVWRYWSAGQHKHSRLPPDMDDTACISHALQRAGCGRPENEWAFRSARDRLGRFRTWLLPTRRNYLDVEFLQARAIGVLQARLRRLRSTRPSQEDARFRVMHIHRNDVDPVVNANAILYLGESDSTHPSIEFITDRVTRNDLRSLYYEDSLAAFHAISRAYRESSPALGQLANPIVNQVELRISKGGLNPLLMALAALTLLNYGRGAGSISSLCRSIAQSQRQDGGWGPFPYYNVWGSEELTTAFCIEAVNRAYGAALSFGD